MSLLCFVESVSRQLGLLLHVYKAIQSRQINCDKWPGSGYHKRFWNWLEKAHCVIFFREINILSLFLLQNSSRWWLRNEDLEEDKNPAVCVCPPPPSSCPRGRGLFIYFSFFLVPGNKNIHYTFACKQHHLDCKKKKKKIPFPKKPFLEKIRHRPSRQHSKISTSFFFLHKNFRACESVSVKTKKNHNNTFWFPLSPLNLYHFFFYWRRNNK